MCFLSQFKAAVRGTSFAMRYIYAFHCNVKWSMLFKCVVCQHAHTHTHIEWNMFGCLFNWNIFVTPIRDAVCSHLEGEEEGKRKKRTFDAQTKYLQSIQKSLGTMSTIRHDPFIHFTYVYAMNSRQVNGWEFVFGSDRVLVKIKWIQNKMRKTKKKKKNKKTKKKSELINGRMRLSQSFELSEYVC